ncbi:MAG TPA: cyclodeaminase/cyclohydrolase family protein [Gemmatimonadales bacterium]
MIGPTVPDENATIANWAEAIAGPGAAPAGGSAAALSGALAAAAVELVAGLTLARERYAPVHERAAAARQAAGRHRAALLSLAGRDAEAFAGFGRALALPRGSEAERRVRDEAKAATLRDGAGIQFEVLGEVAGVADLAAELAEHGLATALGDAAAAGFLAAGAARSAYWAVRSNLQDLSGDPAAGSLAADGLGLLERVEAAEWRIRRLVNERIR